MKMHVVRCAMAFSYGPKLTHAQCGNNAAFLRQSTFDNTPAKKVLLIYGSRLRSAVGRAQRSGQGLLHTLQ